MKKRFKFLFLGLTVVFVLSCIVACSGKGKIHETPKPKAPISSAAPRPTLRPTNTGAVNPTGSPNPVTPSREPLNSDAPQSGEPTGSPDFRQGTVIAPDKAPDTVKAVEKEFSGYGIQSIVCEYYSGREAYKVTLQGEGRLTRIVYVMMNGDIVIPKMT